MRTILLILCLCAACAQAQIYRPGQGGSGGVIYRPSGSNAGRPAAQPANRPRPNGPRPAAVRTHHPQGHHGGYYGPPPVVTGIDVEDGRIRGYHVVSPAIVENPFGGLQGTVNNIRSVPADPIPEPTVRRRYRLSQPSAEEAQTKEETELSLLRGSETIAHAAVSFTEEQLRRHAMDLLTDAYRQNGPQLLPGYEYELTPGGIAREPVNRSFPAASEALLLEAFRAGTPLRVVRPRNVQIPCGMCDGTGKIPVERIVIDGVAGERIITGTCPRCDGSGKRDEQVEALYTIRFTTAGT